jgi:hypothetical protein
MIPGDRASMSVHPIGAGGGFTVPPVPVPGCTAGDFGGPGSGLTHARPEVTDQKFV